MINGTVHSYIVSKVDVGSSWVPVRSTVAEFLGHCHRSTLTHSEQCSVTILQGSVIVTGIVQDVYYSALKKHTSDLVEVR